VQYRDGKGRIESRAELVSVPGMGPKSFEQCAGFLKIPESAEPLDNTWVHPENYTVAREIRQTITATGGISTQTLSALTEKHGVGDTTIRDIAEELKKPNRDPRDGYPRPIMRKGVVTFDDLHEGMMITGKIKNVVDFGAFVDLGIKETALVHVSEMSDRFVKDPLEAVKVGDVFEFRIISLDRERRRIGLSRKSEQKPLAAAGESSRSGGAKGDAKKKVVTVRKTAPGSPAQPHSPGTRNNFDRGHDGQRSARDDDGTMYNPFAAAFKKAGVGNRE
jgi:uncharacterized protein